MLEHVPEPAPEPELDPELASELESELVSKPVLKPVLESHRRVIVAVAAHLNIDLAEYDQRIRTFIPYYEEMLDAAADILAFERGEPTIVELGIGTGALATRVLARHPHARLIGIDEDPAILEAARGRLASQADRLDLRSGNFTRRRLPRSHAVIASFALHHLPDARRKARLYAAIFDSLTPGGMLVSADAHPGLSPRIAAAHIEAWRRHLRQYYSDEETSGYFAAWALEDTYFPLEDERALLSRAGFIIDIVWRRDGFAVIAATKPGRRTRAAVTVPGH